MTRPSASASEARTHDAEKVGLSRYSDFFNRIGPTRTSNHVDFDSAIKSKADVMQRSQNALTQVIDHKSRQLLRCISVKSYDRDWLP
jgi:hypothetical protein